MYVYPLSVNYTSRSTSARNIAVRVQFMDGEDFDASALEVNKFVTDSEANMSVNLIIMLCGKWRSFSFWLLGFPLHWLLNSWILNPDKENLFDDQVLLKLVINFFILMTFTYGSKVIL